MEMKKHLESVCLSVCLLLAKVWCRGNVSVQTDVSHLNHIWLTETQAGHSRTSTERSPDNTTSLLAVPRAATECYLFDPDRLPSIINEITEMLQLLFVPWD